MEIKPRSNSWIDSKDSELQERKENSNKVEQDMESMFRHNETALGIIEKRNIIESMPEKELIKFLSQIEFYLVETEKTYEEFIFINTELEKEIKEAKAYLETISKNNIHNKAN